MSYSMSADFLSLTTESSKKSEQTLPIELYISIFQHVDQSKDLCSLARSSSTFQLVAEPFLYEFVNPDTIFKFVRSSRAIISCPRRHPLVRYLVIRQYRVNGSFEKSSIRRLVARLLMVTVQLRGLKIQEFDTRRWFLHHANHPFLHTFSISTQPAPRETLMGNQDRIDVIGYLGRHPTITKLEVNGKQVISSTYGDPSTFLPNLQIAYFAEPDHINLARDRPLTVVCIGTYFTHTSQIKLALSYLSDMGSTLLALDLSECLDHWQGLITEGLEKLLSNLPRLRYFGLAMKRRDWGGANLQDIMRTCLPTVKILRFNLVEYEARGAREENMKNFFAASESLKWVMITSTYNWAFIPQVRTREDPSGSHVNKSELRRDLWDIGIRLEHWEDAMMLIRRCVVEGGTL